MGPAAVIFIFWMLSLTSFFILFHPREKGSLFPLLFAFKVVSSVFLRLLLFLPAILIPVCESFSLAFLWCTLQFSSVQLLSHVWLFVTPWTAACQASQSITNSQSLLKLMSIKSVMPSNHLILCRPLLLLPSVFLSLSSSFSGFFPVSQFFASGGQSKELWLYSAFKLNKQADNIQPWHTPFPIFNQSVVSCLVLTVASWPHTREL